jgi:Na+-translocating ferredoxin:NAD+ oxidoreductase RnfG subunit/ferredoxin
MLARLLTVAVVSGLGATHAAAQDVERVSQTLLTEVMPAADRFDPADGDPPVKRAYRGDELVGFVFMTSDLPPEETGYSGPVRALVGVTPDGVLTGVHVTDYRESRRYDWGDFLSDPYLLGQFIGKYVGDAFSVGRDIDGITQVTISVNALARGVRNTARKVALAHGRVDNALAPVTDAELMDMSWYEMRRRGIAPTFALRQRGRTPLDISVVHMSSEELGRRLLGNRYDAVAERAAEQDADRVVLFAVVGNTFVPPLREGWTLEQDGKVVALPVDRVLSLGSVGGLLASESSMVGALLLDSDQIDIASPFTITLDRGRPELGVGRVEYTSRAALARVADVERPTAAPAAVEAAADAIDSAASAPTAAPAVAATPVEPEVAATPAPVPDQVAATPAATSDQLRESAVAEVAEDEADVGRVGRTPTSRLVLISAIILLAGLAFFTKLSALRWASLAATMVGLGWVDGGFLSISHVTGLIWVGPSAILGDPALLLMVTVTIVATAIWGRVFCGYLCPFGALQDFIARATPKRFHRELPKAIHRRLWRAKYVILAAILALAVAGVPVSLYQYVEPFGTVFFLSPNVVLWSIAGSILVASAFVPRFYCRYVCPLGGLLGVASFVSPRRIARVEHCEHCTVCQHACPTGAIERERIVFHECVRCSACEVMLRDRRGVCRHDMEEIRPRLVKLRRRTMAPPTSSLVSPTR